MLCTSRKEKCGALHQQSSAPAERKMWCSAPAQVCTSREQKLVLCIRSVMHQQRPEIWCCCFWHICLGVATTGLGSTCACTTPSTRLSWGCHCWRISAPHVPAHRPPPSYANAKEDNLGLMLLAHLFGRTSSLLTCMSPLTKSNMQVCMLQGGPPQGGKAFSAEADERAHAACLTWVAQTATSAIGFAGQQTLNTILTVSKGMLKRCP